MQQNDRHFLKASPYLWNAWLHDYTEILNRGALYKLNIDDLQALPIELLSQNCGHVFKVNYASYLHLEHHSLYTFLYCTAFQFDYLIVSVLKLVLCLLSFANPYFLHQLIDYAATLDTTPTATTTGSILVSTFIFSLIFNAFISNMYDMRITILKAKLKGALSSILLEKALSLNTAQNMHLKLNDAAITNMIQVDIERICELINNLNELWNLPLLIMIAFIALYMYVKEAFLVGILIIILLIPFNTYISKLIGIATEGVMKHKDIRLSFISEAIKGIMSIKIQGYEDDILATILKKRKMEYEFLKNRKYLDCIYVFLWAVLPVIVPLSTFIVANYQNTELSIADVFLSIALLKMLIFPLNSIPWVINSMIDSAVSLSRISDILRSNINRNASDSEFLLPDNTALILQATEFSYCVRPLTTTWPSTALPLQENTNLPTANNYFHAVDIESPSASLLLNDVSSEEKSFTVGPIDVHMKYGEIVAIIGPVGSGKSSFLLGCLGELGVISGSKSYTNKETKISYFPQNQYLISGSIRENILLGEVYEAEKYRQILDGVCLRQDMLVWPGGDGMPVNSSGANLSGGQRARVCLARTLYSTSRIVVLDDVFSSLDANTSAQIMSYLENIVAKEENRLIIMATNAIHLCKHVSQIIVLDHGSVSAQGDFPSLMETNNRLFTDLLSSELYTVPSYDSDIVPLSSSKEHFLDDINTTESTLDFSSIDGNIKWAVISMYIHKLGYGMIAIILVSISIMQLSTMSMDIWLAYWSAHHERITANQFLYISGTICLIIIGGTIIRACSFAFGCLQAAQNIFITLINSIFQQNLNFFEQFLYGSIINILGRDTYTVDDELPFTLNALLAQIFSLFGSILIILFSFKEIIIPLILIFICFHSLQLFYRMSSRAIKRLVSTNRSTVYLAISESLDLSTVIRSQGQLPTFLKRFTNALDRDIMLNINSAMFSYWLSIRMKILGAALIGSIAIGMLLCTSMNWSNIPSQMFGLALSSSMSIVGQLGGLVLSIVQIEQELISVERINECMCATTSSHSSHSSYHGEGEDGDTQSSEISPILVDINTISAQNATDDVSLLDGDISFTNMSIVYGNISVVSNVSFTIKKGSKCAIIGRTGSGKSTFMKMFLRIVRYSGSVTIGGQELSRISERQLRELICVIPQDSLLLTGSIRFNLDLGGRYSDDLLLKCVFKSGLQKSMQSTFGGGNCLDFDITESGSNLSRGQAQLLHISRALLHRRRIILLDEVTSFLDNQAESKLYASLMEHSKDSTVLIICHKLANVKSCCDTVLKFENGGISISNLKDHDDGASSV